VIRRAAGRGTVQRVRAGAYVGTDRWKALDATERHQLEIHAALAAVRTPALVSHRSAAVLWGLPVVGTREKRVHVTFVGSSGAISRGAIARHAVDEPAQEASLNGFRVTSAARTVIDLARIDGFLTGVVAGDAAVRMGLVTREQLSAEAVASTGRRGVRVARDVVAFVDGRSESPGESLSRVRMRELGLPAPDLQHEIRDRNGFVGRVDFWWDDVQVIGEFDGRSKYGIDGPRSATDQLWDEKLREDRLRATNARMARWTWNDAWLGAPMMERLWAAGVRLSTPSRRTHLL